MKKTIIFSAIVLCFFILNVQASPTCINAKAYKTKIKQHVNPFCISIAKGDIETVKKLIDLGTDINEKSNGMSPIMYAAKYNRTEILQLLIKKGANLKARSDKGMTAIKYAKLHKAVETEAILKEALSKNKK